MEKTTRRNLLKAAAIGGVTATGLSAALGAEQKPDQGSEHAHDNRPLTDKRSHVVVSFGQWDVDPARPLDRWPINEEVETRTRNIHLQLPFEAEVDAGGAVSFIISGLHQILIYGPGRELAEVQAAAAGTDSSALGPLPPLVNYLDGPRLPWARPSGPAIPSAAADTAFAAASRDCLSGHSTASKR